MSKRSGSVVATAAQVLGAAAFATLSACGQKGPLIGVKAAAPQIAADVAPDATTAIPASVPTSSPAQR